MKSHRWFQQRFRRDDGVAIVEFALLLPVLLFILFGIIDFGRAFNAQIALQHAVHEGARVYAITQDETEAKARTVDAATTISLQTTDVDIPLGRECDASRRGQPAEVAATFNFEYAVLAFVPAVNPIITLSAEGVHRCGG